MIPVRKTPSNVPAPPMETILATTPTTDWTSENDVLPTRPSS